MIWLAKGITKIQIAVFERVIGGWKKRKAEVYERKIK